MSTTTARNRFAAAGPRVSAPHRNVWWVVVAMLTIIGILYAWARWPGFLPIGSDNDEYQLAGRALAAFEAPLVAGVEGTKYPLGYPAVLAVLEWLRLPVARSALVLNLIAVAGAVTLVARLAGRAHRGSPANPGAGLAAGAVVVTSVSIWNDAFSVMPELALLVVVAAMLTALEGQLRGRRLTAAVLLAVAAVLLKTLGILLVVGGFGAVWLAVARRRRSGSDAPAASGAPRRGAAVLLPVGAALATVLLGMVAVRPLPEHTTGYLATFDLRDPFDASRGTLGPVGLLRRAIRDVPATLADLGRAIAMIDAGTAVAVTIAVLGLTVGVVAAHRLRPGTPLGPFALGACVAYAVGMTAWPYHSSRFGIPLVPVAALGAGWLVRQVTDRLAAGPAPHRNAPEADLTVGRTTPAGRDPGRIHRWGSLAVGAGFAAVLVATSWSAVVDRGQVAAERLAGQHAALQELQAFAADRLGDEPMASFDYREVSNRLDRRVRPLPYTSDPATLLAALGDTEVVVMLDIHHVRNRQLTALIDAEPERFTPLLASDGLAVYRVRP